MLLSSQEILQDIKSAAWLESELHPDLDRHRRHEMADICEQGSIERVWRVLALSEAEIRLAMRRIFLPEPPLSTDNSLQTPDSWSFRLASPLPPSSFSFLKEKIHEFLVASVMADRTAVIIPEAAPVWQQRRDEALSSLREFASTSHSPFSPVHRPLWPL